jgi:hypothetical protein
VAAKVVDGVANLVTQLEAAATEMEAVAMDKDAAVVVEAGHRPVYQICNKISHIALRCYNRFDHTYGGDEEHHSANHAVSTSYQVDPNWYTDSGATDHITGNLDRLHMREAYHGNNHVQVSNGSGLRISHTGYSTTNTAAKSLVLKNVLHVPNIAKNLLLFISLLEIMVFSLIFIRIIF